MTPAGNPTTAAGGNPQVQLRHLRAHREFQRQRECGHARVDWATSITREQSGRHVRRHLDAKINLKDPRETPGGRMDTPEGQESLRRLARRITGGHRISPGDLSGLSPSLCARMLRNARRDEDRPPPMEQNFPPEIQERLSALRELRELLSLQGASPRRHREATVILVYACRQCGNLLHREVAETGRERPACPVCLQSLRAETDVTPVAVRNDGSREPIGSVEPHRRRRR